MGTWSVIWWSALGAAGGITAAAAALDIARSARRSRRYCPGRWRRLTTALLPHRWFLGNPCRYDMTGLEPGPDGLHTCPECGRRADPSRLTRSPARVRSLRILAALAMTAIAAWCVPIIRHGRWVPYTPTPALVTLRWAWTGLTGREMHPLLEWELDCRIHRVPVAGWNLRRLIEAYAWQMRLDDRPRAASRAAWKLAALGPPGHEFLRATLRSNHYQSRQLAAHVLLGNWWERPTDDLLRVVIEGLGRDGIAWNDGGVWYLAEHAADAETRLAEGLESPDEQRRAYCARAIVAGDLRSLFGRAVPALVESLRDNTRRNDARHAAYDLIRMGPLVRPAVAAVLTSDDPQQREFAEYILRRIDNAAARSTEPAEADAGSR